MYIFVMAVLTVAAIAVALPLYAWAYDCGLGMAADRALQDPTVSAALKEKPLEFYRGLDQRYPEICARCAVVLLVAAVAVGWLLTEPWTWSL